MYCKTFVVAAILAVLPTVASAAPVIVNFSGTYDVNQTLAGTGFTGSFAYDDATPASTTQLYYGSTIARYYNNFLTSAFTITNNLGTFAVAPANANLSISYAPEAGSSISTIFSLSGGTTAGDFLVFSFTPTGDPAFAANGLPKASDFTLSSTRPASASANFNSGVITSLSANGAVTPAVPEPATWGMMIVGFGMVGGVARRRTARRVVFA